MAHEIHPKLLTLSALLLASTPAMYVSAAPNQGLEKQVALAKNELDLEKNQLAIEQAEIEYRNLSKQPAESTNFEPLNVQNSTLEQVMLDESTHTQENNKTTDSETSTVQTTVTPTDENTPDTQTDPENNQENSREATNTQPNNESEKENGAEKTDDDAQATNTPVQTEAEKLLAKVAPAYDFEPVDETNTFAMAVNTATWFKGMKVNPYTTIKLQILLDWNHSSPGPVDNGWGMNSRKALKAFEERNGFDVDGRLDAQTWEKLTQGELATRPALVTYTITEADVKTRFRPTARGYEGKSKMRRLSYRDIYEMYGERFHMHVNFLKELNKGIPFKAGNKITVVNVGKHNTVEIDRVVADKKKETLYAYNGDTLVATYPTTVGSSKTPSPKGTHRITNKVYMPYYNATSKKDPKKKWVLPPGPNNPVGSVWIGLSKRSYGIHGSPRPEGISRQASAGCVRLTNWDAAELYATIKKGAKIEFKD